jgi:hypothetical protein
VAITVSEGQRGGYPETSMGFLDNLENSLKSLESQEDGREAADRQQRARESEREQAQAIAPFAEQLKKSPFTEGVLTHAARVGHSMRTKVHVAWLGATLRLEARGRRLELRPTATGIVAVSIEDGNETACKPLDLSSNPERFIRDWLSK